MELTDCCRRLVSGLQGGIEHLQKELDSLKRALGIDDED